MHELLALVGLPDAGPKYPAQLSGGQQQRVALARALATSPGLLLLDEPLSALDARVRLRLRHEIKALQRRLGVTTIMVTHDQEEALTMADRIVVMNQGAIEQVGTPQEIYRQPATRLRRRLRGLDELPRRHARGAGPRQGRRRSPSPARRRTGWRSAGKVQSLHPARGRARARPAGRHRQPRADRGRRSSISSAPSAAPRSRCARGDVTLVADFSSNLIRDLGVQPGSQLDVALPPDRLRVFAA